VEPLRLEGDDAEVRARCRVPTRSGEWSFDDDDAGAAAPVSSCAAGVIAATGTAARPARRQHVVAVFGRRAVDIVSPRKDERLIETPNALAEPATVCAWGITLPGYRTMRHTSSPTWRLVMARVTKLQLRPGATEGETRLSLVCTVPDSIPAPVLYQLLSLLAFWGGRRLDVALDAAGPAGWLEVWADMLADVPERHIRVRFDLSRQEDERAAE
jgi:hypothetical protein